MADKKQKRPTESVKGLYAAIPITLLDSTAFREAGHPAKALLLEVLRQHNGSNNGHLQMTCSWLRSRGWKSRDVIERAKSELLSRCLLLQTRKGGLNMGADLFAVTWLPITKFNGLDIQPKDYHPGAWSFMDKLPMGNIKNSVPADGKVSTGERYSTVPACGTVQ